MPTLNRHRDDYSYDDFDGPTIEEIQAQADEAALEAEERNWEIERELSRCGEDW